MVGQRASNKSVVIRVRTDPEPHEITFGFSGQRTMV
jgi:hypothetical protein